MIFIAKGMNTMEKDPFEEYFKDCEPAKEQKGYLWSTAIGLQAVDGLKPSSYLIDTAIHNIKGDISLDEAERRIENYYKNRPSSATRTTRFSGLRAS